MKTRTATITAMLCGAALVASGPADAKKKRDIHLDVSFSGCATFVALPACVIVDKYNVTGSGIHPGLRVSGIGKTGYVSPCPGTAIKVTSFKIEGFCGFWPWPLPR